MLREKIHSFDFGVRAFGIAAIGCAAGTAWFLSSGSQAVWHLVEARWWVSVGAPKMQLIFSLLNVSAVDIVRDATPEIWRAASRVIYLSPLAGLVGAAVLTALFSLHGGGLASKDKHLRGARIVPSWRLRARLEFERLRDRVRGRGPCKKPVRIGSLPVPRALETLHFIVSGSTGVGKSQQFHAFLDDIRSRGDRAVVADNGQDLLPSHVAKGDSLLNPLDVRSRAWSPFAEIRSTSDAVRIAQSMIPAGEGEHGEWHRYSQSLIASVLVRLLARGEATNERLLYYLTTAKSEEIEMLVEGLPAQTLFDVGAAKMLASVRGIIGSYLPAYGYLKPNVGMDGFSISRWVKNDDKSCLWLPYCDKDSAALRPLLSTWIAEAVSAVLSLRPDPDRRIWLLLDETASLGRVAGLESALTKGRKYGLCAVIGIQSVSQLREIYGREGATTLLSCARSAVTFATDDPDTADYMSRRIGEQEVQREEQSRGDHGSTVSTRRDRSRIVLPSEVENLPNLTAFLNLAGDYPAAKIRIPYRARAERIKPFIPRIDPPLAAPADADPLSHLLRQIKRKEEGAAGVSEPA